MYFIYFLSVITNLIAGLFLISDLQKKYNPLANILNIETWRKQGFVVFLSAITLLIGIIKIIYVTTGNIRILGDLLPATAGILQGIVVFLLHGTAKKEDISKDISTILSFHKHIGYAGILIAVIHAIFPGILFL